MDEPQLLPVFIPALVVLLRQAEQRKGSPLTEQEVLDIRDNGGCMMMPVKMAIMLDEKRGHNDLDPARVWEQWQGEACRAIREGIDACEAGNYRELSEFDREFRRRNGIPQDGE